MCSKVMDTTMCMENAMGLGCNESTPSCINMSVDRIDTPNSKSLNTLSTPELGARLLRFVPFQSLVPSWSTLGRDVTQEIVLHT